MREVLHNWRVWARWVVELDIPEFYLSLQLMNCSVLIVLLNGYLPIDDAEDKTSRRLRSIDRVLCWSSAA